MNTAVARGTTDPNVAAKYAATAEQSWQIAEKYLGLKGADMQRAENWTRDQFNDIGVYVAPGRDAPTAQVAQETAQAASKDMASWQKATEQALAALNSKGGGSTVPMKVQAESADRTH